MSEVKPPRLQKIDWLPLIAVVAVIVVVAAIFAANPPPCNEPANQCPYQQAYKWIWETMFSAAFWTAAFTGALTVSTILLWSATRDAVDHARADAERQSSQMSDSITAANTANSLTERVFRAEQRPWIGIENIHPIGFMVVTPSEDRVDFNVQVTIKNFGRTPAIHCGVYIFAHPDNRSCASQIERKLNELRTLRGAIDDTVVVPGQPQGRQCMFNFPMSEAPESDGVIVEGEGFVAYRSVGDSELHFTKFVIFLAAAASPGPTGFRMPFAGEPYRPEKMRLQWKMTDST